MTAAGRLRVALVLVALHLMILLVPGAVQNIWPPRTNDVIWRIVFTTQLFNGLGLPLAGLVLLLLVGYLSRSRALVATVMALSGLVVVIAGALALLLLLDFLQIRPTVLPAARREWDLSTLVPVVSGGVVSVCLLVVAVAGWAVLKQMARIPRRPSEDGGPRIVIGR